jgi:hypothetical protein
MAFSQVFDFPGFRWLVLYRVCAEIATRRSSVQICPPQPSERDQLKGVALDPLQRRSSASSTLRQRCNAVVRSLMPLKRSPGLTRSSSLTAHNNRQNVGRGDGGWPDGRGAEREVDRRRGAGADRFSSRAEELIGTMRGRASG